MKHSYNGVCTKTGEGFILYNQHTEWNLNKELKSFWQLALPTHIRIETDNRVLMNQADEEIYYDKNEKGKYQLHINDVNIESVLERAINKQIYVTIETGRIRQDGTANSES